MSGDCLMTYWPAYRPAYRPAYWPETTYWPAYRSIYLVTCLSKYRLLVYISTAYRLAYRLSFQLQSTPAITDALVDLRSWIFRTSKIPPLYRTAHIMHLFRTGWAFSEKLIPVPHTYVPRYTGQKGNNLIQIGLVWYLHTLYCDQRESFSLVGTTTLREGLVQNIFF